MVCNLFETESNTHKTRHIHSIRTNIQSTQHRSNSNDQSLLADRTRTSKETKDSGIWAAMSMRGCGNGRTLPAKMQHVHTYQTQVRHQRRIRTITHTWQQFNIQLHHRIKRVQRNIRQLLTTRGPMKMEMIYTPFVNLLLFLLVEILLYTIQSGQ